MAKSISAGLPEIQAVLDGLSFGLGDELMASLESSGRDGLRTMGLDVAEVDYDTALRENRAAQKKFEKDNFGMAMGLNVLGSLPYMFVPGGNIVKAGSLLAKITRGAAQGAAGGFAGGFGEGEGGEGSLDKQIMNRATSGLFGAAAGGVFGAGAPAAGRGLQSLYRKVKGQPFTDQSANRVVGQSLDDSGITPDNIRGQVREMTEDGLNKPIVLADVAGPNALNLLERAATKQGPAMATARNALEERQGGRLGRLKDDFQRTGAVTNVYDLGRDIAKRRREEAAPLYREGIYKAPRITGGRVVEFIEDNADDFQAAWPAARRLLVRAKKKGDVDKSDIPEKLFDDAGLLNISHPAEFDFLQRSLRDRIDKTNLSDGGLGATEKGQLNSIHRELIDGLNDSIVTPDGDRVFERARRIYAGESEALRAIEDGRKFLKMDAEQILEQLEGIQSTAGKESYLSGAVRAIEDSLSRRKDPATATVFRSDNLDKIKALAMGVSDSPEAGQSLFKRIMRRVDIERNMADTEQRVLGGSPTARRMPDPQGGGMGPVGFELAAQALTPTGGVGLAASKLLGGVTDIYNKEVDGRVAEKLLGGPAEMAALLRQLEALSGTPSRLAEQYVGGPGGGSVIGQRVPGLLEK